MQRKARTPKGPSKISETLANAASLFQVPNMTVLASNTGIPIDANVFMTRRPDGGYSPEINYRPIDTRMCPW
jgi:hypothetical protein